MDIDASPHKLLQDTTLSLSCFGSPTVHPDGYAMFNGLDDGIFLSYNPLAGSTQFSVSIMIRPCYEGSFEQRFFHIQDKHSENRFLMEIRLLAQGMWYADTYFEVDRTSVMLQEPRLLHKSNIWRSYCVSYDGKHLSHSIDGFVESSKPFFHAFLPNDGVTSIGMRANRTFPFYGDIGTIRLSGNCNTEKDKNSARLLS